MIRVVTVRVGDAAYEPLLGPVRGDPALLGRVWADAESGLDEAPGKVWCVARDRPYRPAFRRRRLSVTPAPAAPIPRRGPGAAFVQERGTP